MLTSESSSSVCPSVELICLSHSVVVLGNSDCNFLLAADVPGPVKELRVTDITRSTARLIWKLPDSDGGERIKSYFLEKKSLSDKAWTTVNITLSIYLSVHIVLIPGFQVRFESCFCLRVQLNESTVSAVCLVCH